jgi:Bax protein
MKPSKKKIILILMAGIVYLAIGIMFTQSQRDYMYKVKSNKGEFIAMMKPKIEKFNQDQPDGKKLPYKLVIAVSALETGWGTSRFAKEANNYFGEWTWTQDGIVPSNRKEGLTHKIRKFENIEDSIRGFYHNINNHNAYKGLRKIREDAEIVTAELLLPGLLHYSERKEEYLKLLDRVIKSIN